MKEKPLTPIKPEDLSTDRLPFRYLLHGGITTGLSITPVIPHEVLLQGFTIENVYRIRRILETSIRDLTLQLEAWNQEVKRRIKAK